MILLAGSIGSANNIFSQSDSSAKLRKNIVEISIGYPTALEGRIFKRVRGEKWTEPVHRSFGIAYLRYFGKRNWALEISSRNWWGGYTGPNTDIGELDMVWHKQGDILSRTSGYISGAIHWPIIDHEKIRWYASSDLTYRYGFELLAISHHLTSGGWPELIAGGMRQRDIGVSLGTRFSWFPVWRIALSTDFRYTRFIYRYYKPDPSHDWDKGTTKNLLMLQLKLGFCF